MTTTTVDSTAGLMSALSGARDGDTILLAPGTYSGIASKKPLAVDGTVTITSADPNNQAVITDFHLTNVKGLTFTNLEFQALQGGFAFEIKNAENVHFDHVSFHGSLDGDSSNDPSGLGFAGGTNVSVTNSEFQQLLRAMAISKIDGLTISGNYSHDLRSDGFNLAQVSNVKITENVFRNFTPTPTDHPDAIQFWTTGTTEASHDILIANNLIARGDGAYTQGIFLRDQVGTLPYERVTIADNTIVGTGYNGIRIQGIKDLTLTGNDVITIAGQNYTNILIQGGDGITSTANHTNRAIGYDKSINVSQAHNSVTPDVTDQGLAAIREWITENPSAARYVSSFLPGVIPTNGPGPHGGGVDFDFPFAGEIDNPSFFSGWSLA